jgi:parallel beta-helix repeat protein
MRKTLHHIAVAAGLLCLVAIWGCDTPPPATEVPTVEPPRDEIHVAVDGSGDYATLEEAVAAAVPRATITLGPGEYRLIWGLEIKNALTLVGAGMDETTIVSGSPDYVIRFAGTATFAAEGIAFRHDGSQVADVVVIEDGTGRFSRCSFSGATYVEGEGNRAGLRFSGSSRGSVEDSLVFGNSNTGILLEEQARPELRRNSVRDNTVVGIGYKDLARGVASENTCTGHGIGIAVSVEARPTVEMNTCNDNDYGIAYLENGGGECRGNECRRNKIGIVVGPSSTVELVDNDCRENVEEDIRDDRAG